MSLSAQDIVALARAGFNAEQISAINAESTQSPAPTVSPESTGYTVPTESNTISTVSTESTNPSTAEEPVQETNPTPASEPAKPAAAAQDQSPTMQDLMAKLSAMENRLQTNAILNDQQPGQQGALTGQDVLARILDPTIE